MKRLLFGIILILLSQTLFSQNILIGKPYPANSFRPPLDILPSLSGSFGEIRGNHFHSGLDYRTNQREGYPVYAAADGYVSRLRVQNGGFGNAVYINHPNGYTTVYAHLQRFNKRITEIVNAYQYRIQSFDVDFPLFLIEIPVKKGEVIGWSGNTGSSGGPHLHFEVRDSKTQEVLNPQLFGIDIPDKVKPVIGAIYMYRLNGLPFSQNTTKQYFQVTGTNGNYKLRSASVINIVGEVGFGISTYDQHVVYGNQNGVYSIELALDGTTIYASALEGFYFDNSRAVNSHIDYPALLTSGRRIQKSFVEPGNPLSIYKTLVNGGLIKLEDDQIHNLEYIVKDAKGNTSTLSFRIKNNLTASFTHQPKEGINRFYYNKENIFEQEDIKVEMPQGSLYSDIDFLYSKSGTRGFSAVHTVHTRFIPVHIPYTIYIKPDSTLKPSLYEKALIVDTRGASQNGSYEDGWIKTTVKTFGSFYVSTDTISPSIRPVNVADNKSFTNGSKLIFKISDNLSGIKSFAGYIDGQWVLMEYDPKTATLWHKLDERTSAGGHHFQLLVADMKSNSSTYNATIYVNK